MLDQRFIDYYIGVDELIISNKFCENLIINWLSDFLFLSAPNYLVIDRILALELKFQLYRSIDRLEINGKVIEYGFNFGTNTWITSDLLNILTRASKFCDRNINRIIDSLIPIKSKLSIFRDRSGNLIVFNS